MGQIVLKIYPLLMILIFLPPVMSLHSLLKSTI